MLKHYKKALDYFIDKNEGCAYSLDFYFADELANHLGISDIDTIELLHEMTADGYLEYNVLQCGEPYGVHLSYKGLHYWSYIRKNVLSFIAKSILVPIIVTIITTLITSRLL